MEGSKEAVNSVIESLPNLNITSQNQHNQQNALHDHLAEDQPRLACNLIRSASDKENTSKKRNSYQSPLCTNSDGHMYRSNTWAPDHNWQARTNTLHERFSLLFNNEVLADVHFLVGTKENRRRIPGHKLILSCGSAVFDALFNGALARQGEDIEIPDVEPTAFLILLKFLYSDAIDIDSDSVMATLYTAKKYGVLALETHCVTYLQNNLRSDNALILLAQAQLFDETNLAAMCLACIDRNPAEAFSADGFTDIDHDSLCLVLERDTLVIAEAQLFQAVLKWAEAVCRRNNLSPTPENQRDALGRALHLIRFPLMSMEEFTVIAVQSGILTNAEAVQVLLYFYVNPKPPVGFVTTPRCNSIVNETTVCRFENIESGIWGIWGYSGTSDRVRFSVDRRIFVVGFGLYGSTVGAEEYKVVLQLIHTDTGKLCGSTSTTFVCDGSNYTFRVPFKNPIEIIPNTSYIAAATIKGPDTYYGTKGLSKVSVDVPGSGRVTFQFSYAAGNNNGTSVEDGQIPEIIFHL